MSSAVNDKMQIWHVRVQWGRRMKSIEECVETSLQQFDLLEKYLGATEWQQVSDKLLAKDVSCDINNNTVTSALLAGRQREEVNPFRVIENLGVSCWFRNAKKVIDLQIHCGSYADRVGNDCHFSLDQRGEMKIGRKAYVDLLREMLELWDADFGVVYLEDKPVASASELLVRYAKPQEQYHSGFPPVGKIVGQWRGGRVWALKEFEGCFGSWTLEPPRPLSIVEKAKFLLNS